MRKLLLVIVYFFLATPGVNVSGIAYGATSRMEREDFLQRLREGGRLTYQEKSLVEKIKNNRMMTRKEVAEHLEKSWKNSEKKPGYSYRGVNAGKKTGRKFTLRSGKTLKRDYGEEYSEVILLLLIGGVVILGDILIVMLKKRFKAKSHLKKLQNSVGATDLFFGEQHLKVKLKDQESDSEQ